MSQQEEFKYIIDPETNQQIPVNSSIGSQVIKNYLACLKGGPDSEDIVSTKIMYATKKKRSNKRMEPVYEEEKEPEISMDEIYEGAKHLPLEQYELEEVYDKYKHTTNWTPQRGTNVWVRRSNNKWQMALVSEINRKSFDVYINAGNDKVGTKKGLTTSKALPVL